MLWLPKWLRQDEPPLEREGVTRRTFLFLGAATAASVVLPAPRLEAFAETWTIPLHVGRNMAAPDRYLYGRIVIPWADINAAAERQPWKEFLAAEARTYERMAADLEARRR